MLSNESLSSHQTLFTAALSTNPASTDCNLIDQHLRLLQAVRTFLSHTLEPADFFSTVTDSLHLIFGYPRVGIYMLEAKMLTVRHIFGFALDPLQIMFAQGSFDSVIEGGEPLWLGLASNFGVPGQNLTQAALAVAAPLFVQGRVAGILHIESSAEQPFTDNDFKFVETLSEYVSFGLEQMRLITALRQSEQRHRALLDTVPDLMFVHAADGRYLDFHTTRFYTPKIPFERAIGKRIGEVFDQEFEDRIMPVFRQVLETGEVQSIEYSLKESDGEHCYETRLVAYGPDKVLSIVRDITFAKHVEQLRAQRLLELESASRAKDEFLATMSHELRTPLHSMLTLNESLREQTYGPISKEQQNVLSTIDKSGQHLLALINDILDIAKIEAGKLELEKEQVFVREVIATCLEMIQESATRKGLMVIQAVDESVTTLLADERRLVQVLINLLSNAVKFTPEGGMIGLEVKNDPLQQQIKFIVWDTGIGIAKEDCAKLFKPFVQLDSSLSRSYEGTGLGLALVRRLTEMHGGSVSLESAPQQGSRFTVSIPLSLQSLVPPAVAQMRSATTLSHRTNATKAINLDADGPLILLAEDNSSSQGAIEAYLSAHSYQVITASNGVEAILKATTHHPDVILMDIQMPEVDGLQATRQIRKNHTLAHVPIVALTALAMPGDRERCLAAGINEYLSKPVSLRQLIKVIETQLTKGTIMHIQ